MRRDSWPRLSTSRRRGVRTRKSRSRCDRAPLPEIVTRLPKSRHEVLSHLTHPDRIYFGDELAGALEHAAPQRRLWLVEAALGVHHLEIAARLGEGAMRAVILDDWLLDFE